ncbi:hypothetical protein RRG08_064949 [Elysia crispata]|uniref:Uncharacterized protein n=1 Tax=Elysia crispata TaxID=231223 RepID=A0AAE0XR36_9GAST|nr:hypothetical protein RRG08_064949 [Elysia crispata]
MSQERLVITLRCEPLYLAWCATGSMSDKSDNCREIWCGTKVVIRQPRDSNRGTTGYDGSNGKSPGQQYPLGGFSEEFGAFDLACVDVSSLLELATVPVFREVILNGWFQEWRWLWGLGIRHDSDIRARFLCGYESGPVQFPTVRQTAHTNHHKPVTCVFAVDGCLFAFPPMFWL